MMKNSANPPIYSQVAFDIAAKIASGEIKEKERFTGRSLMGSQYGVSAETIRRAMRLLEDMGIVSVQVNVGYTVLSQKRAVEYIEQFQESKNLLVLKRKLRDMIAQREALNEEINQTMEQIVDLAERFRRSDRLRTYEFTILEDSLAAKKSIGELQFRQKTGATVVAVQKAADVLLSPGPQIILEQDDILIVACEISQLALVSELLGTEFKK